MGVRVLYVVAAAVVLAVAGCAAAATRDAVGRRYPMVDPQYPVVARGGAPSGDKRWFNQTLDHFRAAGADPAPRWQQKYYVDSAYWAEGKGPVLLYINGEAPCDGVPDNWMRQYAQEVGALMIALEHRMYGESQPFASLSAENLFYLSSKQAIEDIAVFMAHYRRDLGARYPGGEVLPWVTIGCSYAGALSAWYRLKHPEQTRGSISSSGVVHSILDFTAFDEQIAIAAGPRCADQLRSITAEIERSLREDRASTLELFDASYFEDDGDFFYLMADAAAETIQYGFGPQFCQLLSDNDGSPNHLMHVYAQFLVEWWYPKFNGGPHSAVGYTTKYQQLEFPGNAGRAWWWQKCSELAYFQNAPEKGAIRSHYVNMTYHRTHCAKVFGNALHFPPDTVGTNEYYGGENNRGSRIFYLNSSQDPWQRASIVDSELPIISPAEMIVCADCGHCSDLRGCPSLASWHNTTGCASMDSVDRARDHVLRRLKEWIA